MLLHRFAPAEIGKNRLVAGATNPSDQARVNVDDRLSCPKTERSPHAAPGCRESTRSDPWPCAAVRSGSATGATSPGPQPTSDRRQFRRKALDAAQGLEQVDELPNRQLRHVRAPPRHELDKSFGGENLQRFAQRGPRNLELLAELRLVDPFARDSRPSTIMSRIRSVASSCSGRRRIAIAAPISRR